MKIDKRLEKLIELTEQALEKAAKVGDARAVAALAKEARHNLKLAMREEDRK